jgi:hypothetical protein
MPGDLHGYLCRKASPVHVPVLNRKTVFPLGLPSCKRYSRLCQIFNRLPFDHFVTERSAFSRRTMKHKRRKKNRPEGRTPQFA